MSTLPPPHHILVLGHGVFGLSTAYSLTQSPLYAHSKLTVLDRSPFPSPDGSSIDTSRIVRADYCDAAYAALGAAAQRAWRERSDNELGGEGRYCESGLVLVADRGTKGEGYVRGSLGNVLRLAGEEEEGDGVRMLSGREEIEGVMGTGGGSGDWGYVNLRSGWADAEGGMRWLRGRVEGTGRVEFVLGEVEELLKSRAEGNGKEKITGVKLKDGSVIEADLVILATGAWTGKLVDLRGRATATGQVLVYLNLTEEEQERLGKMPILLNMSTGLFIIPPKNRVLKVARHAYGYSNLVKIRCPNGPEEGKEIEISVPCTGRDYPSQWVPKEGEEACRAALAEMIPSLADRPFTKARICWYTDTPKGDFLISYHPEIEGLFLATGGSGHGYKFLPVIGDRIVDCLSGQCPMQFKEKWAWPKEAVEKVVTEDGSRGGRPGMMLDEEFRKG